MSINKLSHLKEWEKIYLELERKKCRWDDADGLNFYSKTTGEMWMDDDDTFYTLNDMKQLANDGMPKQGEMIEVSNFWEEWGDIIRKWKFVSFYDDKVIIFNPVTPFYSEWDSWRYPPQKTELTLAEVEEKLGMEKGSLIIKD